MVGARARTAWAFLAPTLFVLALAAGWPLLRTVLLGFTDTWLGDPQSGAWIGLENYLARFEGRWTGLLADPQWWRAAWNTSLFAAASVALETVLGVAIALVLNAEFRGRALLRAAVLVPWAIPTVVSAKLWSWMLNDQFGVINEVLLAAGAISAPLAWTADPRLVLPTVVLVDVWKTTPFMALLALAALQLVPKDCHESARVDGAGPLRIFFDITLPIIRPALVVAAAFRALDALRAFDLIYVLTANDANSMTLAVFARQQLADFQDIGYGSAAATLLFFFVALAAALILTAGRARISEAGTLQ
jgi:trehalose/maltose transport system permease protein